MSDVLHKVVKGDTLPKLALKYGTTVAKIADLNNIENVNLIYIGQTLVISGKKLVKKVAKSNRPIITAFGIQSDTDRTFFATWAWNKEHVDHYKVFWQYKTGDGIWFNGGSSDEKYKQYLFTPGENAKKIRFKVKAVSTKHKVNKKDVPWWIGEWSTYETYDMKNSPPKTPGVPEVTINVTKLTAELNNIDTDICAKQIEFQVVKNDKSVYKSGKATIKTRSASWSCTVADGTEYKVRCRSIDGEEKSSWSDYSSEVGTRPTPPKKIDNLKALTSTSVYLSWPKVTNATSYKIEYTTKKRYFDSNPSSVTSVEVTTCNSEIVGLETGEEYFFRLCAINSNGDSKWTDIKSIILGKKPAAPTTWSSSTTVKTGDILKLYWTHNSIDGSSQTYAQLELTINGVKTTETIENKYINDEDKKNSISIYDKINTSSYTEGTEIKWRVRTRGITNTYSDWSVMRTVTIYTPPTISVTMMEIDGTDADGTISMYPFYVRIKSNPTTQNVIGYHFSITSEETYFSTDNIGNEVVIGKGDELYSEYMDSDQHNITKTFYPTTVNLDNNRSYKLTCTVSMDSGLTDTETIDFDVSLSDDLDEEYQPELEHYLDKEKSQISIRPYMEDENGELIPNITLAVYRREYNGKFIEIGSGINNDKMTFITDLHPSLDYARYRIVATSNNTGNIVYYDVPGIPINEKNIIINWNERPITFDTDNEDELEESKSSGLMLKIPYNIDVTESNDKESTTINYIGREHPVSYYGTQLGIKTNWNCSIPKEDKGTIYLLRQLQIYMGDVYVREPSGVGYWANVSVSFNQTHCEPTIPVTFDITRVEGGA